MKSKLYMLFFSAVLILGCSEDTVDKNQNSAIVRRAANPVLAPHAVVGNWNWLESSGGISGGTITPASTGNNILLKISATTVKTYVNGTLTQSVPYTLETHASIFGGNREMLTYASDFIPRQSYQRNGNHLTLADECYDCFISQYIKQ